MTFLNERVNVTRINRNHSYHTVSMRPLLISQSSTPYNLSPHEQQKYFSEFKPFSVRGGGFGYCMNSRKSNNTPYIAIFLVIVIKSIPLIYKNFWSFERNGYPVTVTVTAVTTDCYHRDCRCGPFMDNLTIIEIKPLTFQINFFYYLHTNEFDSLSLLRWNWHWQKKTRV